MFFAYIFLEFSLWFSSMDRYNRVSFLFFEVDINTWNVKAVLKDNTDESGKQKITEFLRN